MIVGCGGGTDLDYYIKITNWDFCSRYYVDREFLKFPVLKQYCKDDIKKRH